jgi:hypothetical protein
MTLAMGVRVPEAEISEICRRYRVKELSPIDPVILAARPGGSPPENQRLPSDPRPLLLTVMGKAAALLSRELLQRYPLIPWADILRLEFPEQ